LLESSQETKIRWAKSLTPYNFAGEKDEPRAAISAWPQKLEGIVRKANSALSVAKD
jgi:hypothetical protein